MHIHMHIHSKQRIEREKQLHFSPHMIPEQEIAMLTLVMQTPTTKVVSVKEEGVMCVTDMQLKHVSVPVFFFK